MSHDCTGTGRHYLSTVVEFFLILKYWRALFPSTWSSGLDGKKTYRPRSLEDHMQNCSFFFFSRKERANSSRQGKIDEN